MAFFFLPPCINRCQSVVSHSCRRQMASFRPLLPSFIPDKYYPPNENLFSIFCTTSAAHQIIQNRSRRVEMRWENKLGDGKIGCGGKGKEKWKISKGKLRQREEKQAPVRESCKKKERKDQRWNNNVAQKSQDGPLGLFKFLAVSLWISCNGRAQKKQGIAWTLTHFLPLPGHVLRG